MKKDLSFISKNYKDFKNEKNYLKRDLKKNTYKLGKINIKKLIVFIYSVEKEFSFNMLKKIIDNIDKMVIPNFPFDGKYVIEQGLEDGKKIGYVLRALEEEWIKNNFNLKAQEATSIVNKVKN